MAKIFRPLAHALWTLIAAVIVAVAGGVALYMIQQYIAANQAEKEKAIADADALSVTYYRISGLGLRLLTDGCLTPEWEKVFGRQPSIVQNSILKEARDFLEEYGTTIYGDILFGEFPKDASQTDSDLFEIMRSTGCLAQSVPSAQDWKTYLAGTGRFELFVPDVSAAATVFGSLEWPRNYEFATRKFVSYPSEGENGAYLRPIWRYVVADDFTNYERRYKEYQTRLLADLRSDRHWTSRTGGHDVYYWQQSYFNIVRSLKFITQGGVPEGFMAITGNPGVHGGWAFSAQVRDLELLIAVYENVTESAINIGPFTYRETVRLSLRTERETDEILSNNIPKNKKLFPIITLTPGEAILIPIRVQFALPEQDIERETNPTWNVSGLSIRRVGNEDILSYADVFEKRMSAYRNPMQARLERRFDFGPAWTIESVVINGTKSSIRQYDTDNFLLYAGAAKGSCPIVSTLEPDIGLWRNQGEILVKAVGGLRKMEDKLLLRDFHGIIDIREEEAKITILDSAAIVLKDKSTGLEELLFFDAPELRRDDGETLILNTGESIRKDFNSYEKDWERYEISLIVSGFYVPFAMQTSWVSK